MTDHTFCAKILVPAVSRVIQGVKVESENVTGSLLTPVS